MVWAEAQPYLPEIEPKERKYITVEKTFEQYTEENERTSGIAVGVADSVADVSVVVVLVEVSASVLVEAFAAVLVELSVSVLVELSPSVLDELSVAVLVVSVLVELSASVLVVLSASVLVDNTEVELSAVETAVSDVAGSAVGVDVSDAGSAVEVAVSDVAVSEDVDAATDEDGTVLVLNVVDEVDEVLLGF